MMRSEIPSPTVTATPLRGSMGEDCLQYLIMVTLFPIPMIRMEFAPAKR